MAIKCIHAVLDDLVSQVLVIVDRDVANLGYRAKPHQQVDHALRQVEVVEERLDEVALVNDELQEPLRLLNEPEGENLVQIAAQGRVEVAYFLLKVGVWLLVVGD